MMCLAIPGQVVEWLNRDPLFASALVEFSGVRRSIHLACVPDCRVGDYVLVHAGVAICQIDEEEALRVLSTLDEAAEHDGLAPEPGS